MNNTSATITKHYYIHPEKLLYFSIGAILSIVIFSGMLSCYWNINLISYVPDKSLCLFHVLTGKQCPGCGMSRAFLLLGQLRIGEALQINLFSVPLIILMLVYFTLGHIPAWMKTKGLASISLFAVLAFWLVRLLNIWI